MEKKLNLKWSFAKRMFAVLAIVVVCIPGIFAQEEKEEGGSPALSVNADFVSRYVWRGLLLSQSPAIQPGVSYSTNGFTLGTWGSYTFSKESFQEVDLYASYSFGKVSIGLNDYFNPVEDTALVNKYFEFGSKKTGHAIEGMVTVDGPDEWPLQLVVGMFLYGNDRDANANNQYSTYIELNRTWTKAGYSVKPFVGMTTGTGYYSADGMQLVNVGVSFKKEVKVNSDFKVPMGVTFSTNPDTQNVYLVFSASF